MSRDEHLRFTTLFPLPPQGEREMRDLGPPAEETIEEMRGVEMWGGQDADSSASWSEPIDIDEDRSWGGGPDSPDSMAVDSAPVIEWGSGADVGFCPDDRMAVDGEPDIENPTPHSCDVAEQMDLFEDVKDEEMKDSGDEDEDAEMEMGLGDSTFSSSTFSSSTFSSSSIFSSSGSGPPSTANTTPLLTSTDHFTPKVDFSAPRQPTSAETLLNFETAYAELYKSGAAVGRNRRCREQRLLSGFHCRKLKAPVGLSGLRDEVGLDQVMDWTADVAWGLVKGW